MFNSYYDNKRQQARPIEELIEKLTKTGLFIKGLIGSSFVTAVEFIFGVVFNIILKKNVWDYSKMPMNIVGQICMPYSCLWVLLSLVCIPFAGVINRRLKIKK